MRNNSWYRYTLAAFLVLGLLQGVTVAGTDKGTSKKSSGKNHAAAPKKATAKKVSSRSGKRTTATKLRKKRGAWKARGQQSITEQRAGEIQLALIREGYLSGEPTFEMDRETKAALARYQRDHGWQDRIVPDSRALIKLGLGPRHENLLNPETAIFVPPSASGNTPGSNTPR